MVAATQFKFPSISLSFARDGHARRQGGSLWVAPALAEKRDIRKEIAWMRHEKLAAVTFMQQFSYTSSVGPRAIVAFHS
jgi:hypothetical protein